MPYSPQRGGYKSGLPSELSEYSATGGRRRTRRARRSMRGGWADAFASPMSSSLGATALPAVAGSTSLSAAMATNSTSAISQAVGTSPNAAKTLVAAANGSSPAAAAARAILAKPAVARAVQANPALTAQQKATALATAIGKEKGFISNDYKVAGDNWNRIVKLRAEKVAAGPAFDKRVAAHRAQLAADGPARAAHLANLDKYMKQHGDRMHSTHVDAGKHAMALQKLTGSPATSFLPGHWGKTSIPLKGGARRRSRSRSASRKSTRRHRR